MTCGLGVKTRSVECSDIDIPCDVYTKPDTSKRCDLVKCPQWEAGPWGEVCNTKNCRKKRGGSIQSQLYHRNSRLVTQQLCRVFFTQNIKAKPAKSITRVTKILQNKTISPRNVLASIVWQTVRRIKLLITSWEQ